jgi:hypothetical protein
MSISSRSLRLFHISRTLPSSRNTGPLITAVSSAILRSVPNSRTMSTAPEKFEWLVILPDQAGKLAKRMEIRPYVLSYLFKYPNANFGAWRRTDESRKWASDV